MTQAHQHINQTSGDVEYYTPLAIIAAAHLVLGTIDLDRASSATANKRVKAWSQRGRVSGSGGGDGYLALLLA